MFGVVKSDKKEDNMKVVYKNQSLEPKMSKIELAKFRRDVFTHLCYIPPFGVIFIGFVFFFEMQIWFYSR